MEITKMICKANDTLKELGKVKEIGIVKSCTVKEFMNEYNLYLSSDFIAGYLFFNDINYILLNEFRFPNVEPKKINSVLFHECMHLLSNKKVQNKTAVGYVFGITHFVSLNEGITELAAKFLFERTFSEKYYYSKGYNLDSYIANYIIKNMYTSKEDFVCDFVTILPYSFYKKLFYVFQINNLMELEKAIKRIKREYVYPYRIDIDVLLERYIPLRKHTKSTA